MHYFFTEAARSALAETPRGFKIAPIHSPELVEVAADHGYQLYLSGHTHGGQVCLPGGRPVITRLGRHRRRYARGQWRHGRMQGYTSTGVGVSVCRPCRCASTTAARWFCSPIAAPWANDAARRRPRSFRAICDRQSSEKSNSSGVRTVSSQPRLTHSPSRSQQIDDHVESPRSLARMDPRNQIDGAG